MSRRLFMSSGAGIGWSNAVQGRVSQRISRSSFVVAGKQNALHVHMRDAGYVGLTTWVMQGKVDFTWVVQIGGKYAVYKYEKRMVKFEGGEEGLIETINKIKEQNNALEVKMSTLRMKIEETSHDEEKPSNGRDEARFVSKPFKCYICASPQRVMDCPKRRPLNQFTRDRGLFRDDNFLAYTKREGEQLKHFRCKGSHR
ncbi:hypothetical protein V6N13_042617 [Hibiscus sabdariffa]|uniref:Uncharacterized protein n=2 Tax=Hibiscus sabdariffa TaxID=183260 RepID=A0ABR2G4I9_9ROSI